MSRIKEAPEVNAGSMADIAFLLLIFFLVTTTIETDEGLDRLLPDTETEQPPNVIKEKNLLRISLNGQNDLMVEDDIINVRDLRQQAIAFLDNGGAPKGTGEFCGYCKGNGDVNSSDNPQKAIISLTTSRETDYSAYVTVQNELIGAYNTLRNRESMKRFGISYTDMEAAYFDQKISLTEKRKFKKQIKEIQNLFPQKIVEAEIVNQ